MGLGPVEISTICNPLLAKISIPAWDSASGQSENEHERTYNLPFRTQSTHRKHSSLLLASFFPLLISFFCTLSGAYSAPLAKTRNENKKRAQWDVDDVLLLLMSSRLCSTESSIWLNFDCDFRFGCDFRLCCAGFVSALARTHWHSPRTRNSHRSPSPLTRAVSLARCRFLQV